MYLTLGRDSTYIDDIVESVYRCCHKPAYIDKNFDYLNPDQTTSFLLLEYLLLEIVNRLNYLDL